MGTDPLKTLVVDDEKPARDRLIHLLSKDKRVEVVGAAGNGPEAIDRVNEHHPHLILLDIQMPGMDGFDVVRMLNDPPLVIFTTAYDEYAIKAFEIHALDYLLKPIPQKRLSAAIGRAIQEWSAIDGGGRDDWQERLLEAVNAVSPPQRTLARVPVRAGETIRLIDLVDVLAQARKAVRAGDLEVRDQRQGQLGFVQVLARWLAERALRAREVQHVVLDLERDAEFEPEPFEPVCGGLVRPRRQRP